MAKWLDEASWPEEGFELGEKKDYYSARHINRVWYVNKEEKEEYEQAMDIYALEQELQKMGVGAAEADGIMRAARAVTEAFPDVVIRKGGPPEEMVARGAQFSDRRRPTGVQATIPEALPVEWGGCRGLEEDSW